MLKPIKNFLNTLAAAGGKLYEAEPPQPFAERETDLEILKKEYPFVENESLWYAFLQEYGGMSIEFGDSGESFVELLGFDTRVCSHILDGNYSSGFLSFAVISVYYNDRPIRERLVEFGFDFNMNSDERPGVYMNRNKDPKVWFAADFSDWLEKIALMVHDLTLLDTYYQNALPGV